MSHGDETEMRCSLCGKETSENDELFDPKTLEPASANGKTVLCGMCRERIERIRTDERIDSKPVIDESKPITSDLPMFIYDEKAKASCGRCTHGVTCIIRNSIDSMCFAFSEHKILTRNARDEIRKAAAMNCLKFIDSERKTEGDEEVF